MTWKPYAKAIAAGLLAGLGALEWTLVAGATLAGLGGVYAVPNRTAE